MYSGLPSSLGIGMGPVDWVFGDACGQHDATGLKADMDGCRHVFDGFKSVPI